MMHRFALAFLLAGSLTSGAAAQTMEFGCPNPGTVITFDSGTKVVSRGQDGMDCTMEEADGKPFKVRALLISNPGPDGSNMAPFIAALRPERLWPLEVGKKIEARYTTPKASWSYTLGVVRYEKRSGPGDAMFDTFVVEMQEHGDSGFRSVSRWWISPVIKYMIRFDASNSEGTSNRAVVTEVTR
jgi:hypothetical protein